MFDSTHVFPYLLRLNDQPTLENYNLKLSDDTLQHHIVIQTVL